MMQTSLIPIINHTFSGIIWKLESDVASDILYIETRNSENRTVNFSSFSLKNGSVYFEDLLLEERWMIGLEGGRQGILFLHGYKSTQSPEHKALIALDGLTGKQLWADYNLALEAFCTDGLLAADQRFQSKKTALLDYKTGTELKDVRNLEDLQEIKYPQILLLAPQILDDFISGTIVGEISSLNYNSYLIISLHTLNNGNLVQQIFILKNKEIIYQDLLNEYIQKLQPEAFVLIENHLVYLKNKINLKVLNL